MARQTPGIQRGLGDAPPPGRRSPGGQHPAAKIGANGVVLLAAAAAALIIGFDANIDRLIQLYIVGVFTSFTLSQLGAALLEGPHAALGTAPLR